MKTDFTKQEAQTFLNLMRGENDVVRLVDPVGRLVCSEDPRTMTCETCHSLWGRCERCENCSSLRALQTKESAYKMESINGSTYWVCSRYLRIDGEPFIAELVRNVTDRLIIDSDQKNEIGRLINTYNQMLIVDSLTGVYNRRFLDEHFIPSLQCCHEEDITVNLAFLDMDDFKTINDNFGHRAGDCLLKDVAGFWKLHFDSRERGKERMVVRYGGDELVIIACGISLEEFQNEISLHDKEMRKICYLADGVQFHFDFAIGAASSESLGKGWTWEELLNAADQKMYQNKNMDDLGSTD